MHPNFSDIYDRYFDDVYRYIYFKTGNIWDTDDLVSEVFRKACESYGKRVARPKAWLFAIARNTVIDHYRKRKAVAISDELDNMADPCDFADNLEKAQELKHLKELLQQLPQEDQEIISLHYFSDVKYRDIAQILGKTENSIKMKAFRILKGLRETFRGWMEG